MRRFVGAVAALVSLLCTASALDELFSSQDVSQKCHIDPDMCRNASEIIISKGYPCEEHTVVTSDGFLLTLQRIPHGRSTNQSKGVVFLQHGLLGISTNWIANKANQSLGFMLADAGYDVWLGNLRGSTYSRRHKFYKPSSKQFWQWSFDEMAMYDLPAMVNYALKQSRSSGLYYVGHSQGTMIAFARLSMDKRLAKQIKAVVALGPVATVGSIKGALKLFSHLPIYPAEELLKILGVKDFLPNLPVIKYLASTLCDAPTRFLCSNIIFLICGYDVHGLNMTRLPVYLAHTPAGTSVQNIVHFDQMVRSKKFQMFDFGAEMNMKHYDQKTAPLYHPENITTPVALFYGQNDWLADPQDVKLLKAKLKNIVYEENLEKFNHLDFIWGMRARDRVYIKILQLLDTL